MSALDITTDIVITPHVCQNFTLSLAAMAATEDETEAYESLAEAVVIDMSRSLSDSDILDIWITEGYPEPGPDEIDPDSGVWSRVYAGIAEEIARMVGAVDIAEWLGVERSLGVGAGSIVAVVGDGCERRAYHVSERAYGMDDAQARERALRDRPTVPLPEDDEITGRGVYEVTFVDTDAKYLTMIPVDPEDVPVPPHLR